MPPRNESGSRRQPNLPKYEKSLLSLPRCSTNRMPPRKNAVVVVSAGAGGCGDFFARKKRHETWSLSMEPWRGVHLCNCLGTPKPWKIKVLGPRIWVVALKNEGFLVPMVIFCFFFRIYIINLVHLHQANKALRIGELPKTTAWLQGSGQTNWGRKRRMFWWLKSG